MSRRTEPIVALRLVPRPRRYVANDNRRRAEPRHWVPDHPHLYRESG